MDAPAEIKARLPIEELVSQYCQIQKKGRNFVALCPFHNDTHPSLTISPDKGIAYCFACQTGGDIFTFYQKIEGVDFRQSLKDLAEKAGVTLPRERAPAGPKKDEKERMRACLEEALSFYRATLQQHDVAQRYLAERKLTPDLIETFGIGYAPDSFDATYTHLLKAGFSRSEILGAGLGVQKELQEERIYDRFRNRIMFPICDHQGNLIGFGGRTLGDASAPLSTSDAKYINSPDSPLYNKSVALFGLSHAREAIRSLKSVILVEGYFDVLACRRIGIGNVVAVSGTALTEQHAHLLKRYADRICLCLDRDAAGAQAAERAFVLCASKNFDVRSITIPSGKDPDECASIAPEEMRKACEEGGVPYLDAVIRNASAALSTGQEQGMLRQGSAQVRNQGEKRMALQKLLPLLNAISSSVEREEYIGKAAALLGTTVTALKDDLRRGKQAELRRTEDAFREVRSPFSSTDLFLGLLLTYPQHPKLIEQLLEPDDEQSKALYRALKSLNQKPANQQTSQQILDRLDPTIKEHAAVLQMYCEEHFGSWSQSLAEKELKKLCRKINGDALRKKQRELIERIREARSVGKKLEEEQLLTQYQQVLKLSAMRV